MCIGPELGQQKILLNQKLTFLSLNIFLSFHKLCTISHYSICAWSRVKNVVNVSKILFIIKLQHAHLQYV